MTAQALAGMLAGLLLAAVVVAVLLERRRRDLSSTLDFILEDRNRERLELAQAGEREDHLRAALSAQASDTEAARRRLEELELERRRSPLEGELVIVNTPRPDDQTLRGVCLRDLGRERGMVLTAAEYVDTELARGEEKPRRTPLVGEVHVPAYSFAQIVQRTEES